MKSMKNRGAFAIKYPTARFDPLHLTAMSFEIIQEARHHDAAIIRYKTRRVDWRNALAPGTPIQITWSSRTSPEQKFYGYVTHARPMQKHDDYYRFDLYVVGASRVMRATGQDVWRNISAPQLAARLARRFGFQIITIDHPMRKPQIAQAGRSYWETLADLAKQIGYALWASGTTIYFLPISTMVAAGFKEAQVLSAMNPSVKTKRRSEYWLIDFRSVTGLSSERDDYSGESIDVSATTPAASEVSSRKRPGSAVKRRKVATSPYTTYLQGRAVYSKRDADALAQGQADNGLLAIDAQVECEGTAGLHPYAPVYVETQSSATQGWWIVKSVRHRMSLDEAYVCESVLSTDSIYPSSEGKPRRLQNLLERPPATQLASPSKTILRPSRNSPVQGRTSDFAQGFEWRAV